MTPEGIRLQIEAFWKTRKNEWEKAEYQSWLTGYYTMYAIGSNISRKIKYPKNPMEEERVVVEDMELTEEEKIIYQEQLFNRLLLMSNKRKGVEQGK